MALLEKLLFRNVRNVYSIKRFYTCITYIEKLMDEPQTKIKTTKLLPNDTMLITWEDGLRRIYKLDELSENYTCWNGTSFQNNNIPTIDYENFYKIENELKEYGFCVLKNIPDDKINLYNLYIKMQNFSLDSIQIHIASNYIENFRLVDGLWITDILKSRYPSSFNILTQSYGNCRLLPMIKSTANGYSIKYNRQFLPRIMTNMADDKLDDFHTAYTNWEYIVEDRRNCLHLVLKKGQSLFVKNDRVIFV